MGSIYDFGGTPSIPEALVEEKKPRRARKRDPLTSLEIRQGQARLSDMVETAFHALEDAMENADHATSVKAALGILDRAGLGPKSTIDMNTTHLDLSALSKDELAERALKISRMLRSAQEISETIDVTPVTIQ